MAADTDQIKAVSSKYRSLTTEQQQTARQPNLMRQLNEIAKAKAAHPDECPP